MKPILFITTIGVLFITASGATNATTLSNAVYYDFNKMEETLVIDVSVTQTVQSAQNFIKIMGSEAIGFMADSTLNETQKKQKFKELLDDRFDMETIGRFVAGAYWKVMTKEQQDEYQNLFNKLIVLIYSNRFLEYEGQKFIVDSAKNSGDSDFIVQSHIVPLSGENIPISWHVRWKNGNYNIIDVKIKDVSMAISQKSEFSSIIQRGGGDPEVLLKHLKEKVG